jgi:hypothetical protein
MDQSLRRVLEALLPGPGTPRLLVQTYGMGIQESEQALTHAIEEGLAQPQGPIAFELTDEGREQALSLLPADRRERAIAISQRLENRAIQLDRSGSTWDAAIP